jgi:hypothetical protein
MKLLEKAAEKVEVRYRAMIHYLILGVTGIVSGNIRRYPEGTEDPSNEPRAGRSLQKVYDQLNSLTTAAKVRMVPRNVSQSNASTDGSSRFFKRHGHTCFVK